VPLYDYACPACEHTFETLVFDGEAVECPRCHSPKVERQLSLPARPQVSASSLPVGCDPGLPPCGPGCCRLPPGKG
jgi:putative FmdB family regulatory protein